MSYADGNDGDNVLFTVDTEALAAQAAKMNKLVQSIESNLESTTQDLHQEEQAWSETARLSIVAQAVDTSPSLNETDDIKAILNNYDDNYGGIGSAIEENIEKTNERLDTTAIGIEDASDVNNSNNEDGNRLSATDLVSGDLSPASTEALPASASASGVDDESSVGSETSLSLLQVRDGEFTGEADGALCQSETLQLQQEGILQIDESSVDEVISCNWERYREWKERQSQQSIDGSRSNTSNPHNASSQRWADSSWQDSKLKLPSRRDSDNSSFGEHHQGVNQSDGDSHSAYFDWKAWKKRKEGQRSSTSRTGSFSMSISDGDADDNFDVSSVLAKLDEWDTMEEAGRNQSVSDDDGDSCSSSSSEDENGEVQSTEADESENADLCGSSHDSSFSPDQLDEACDDSSSGRTSLNRANSEKLAGGRRASMPSLRSHSDKGLRPPVVAKEELHVGWRQWQSTQRKIRMSESWSSISNNLTALEPDNTRRRDGSDSSLQSQSEENTVLETTGDDSTLDLVGLKGEQKPLNFQNKGNLQRGDGYKTDRDSDKSSVPLVGSPDRQTSDTESNSWIKTRTDSMRMRSPVHQSPRARKRRGIMQRSKSLQLHVKSPLQQSPVKQNMEAWRSWQREKRRSGMLKTASGRDMWNLPFSSDSDRDAMASEKNLLKSQSERWNQKDDSSSPTNPRQKLQRAQSENMHLASSEAASFDWNSFRKRQRKVSTLRRCKSDLCNVGNTEINGYAGENSTTGEEESEPSGRREMRRCSSEKWNMTGRARADRNASPSQAAESFNWKSWRKDRRKDEQSV